MFSSNECKKTIHSGIMSSKIFATIPDHVKDEISGSVGTSRYVTERRRMNDIRLSAEKFSTAFYMSPDAININRLSDGMYLEINEGFTKIMGYASEDVLGKTSVELSIWGDQQDRFLLVDGMKRRGEVANLEAWFRRKDGSLLYGLMSARAININGEVCILSVTRDITERKTLAEQLERLSRHDSLTGMYNRTFFEEEMKRFEGIRVGFAGLLICDVDGLKIMNDTLGHNVGDMALQSVAKIVRDSFRPWDVSARIGGDEFAVLIFSNSERLFKAGCSEIRERINRYNIENPTIPISLSMGFAISKNATVDLKALFREADNKMYREKLHRQKSTRSAIVQALMKALEVRDFQTQGHGERLQDLAASFATDIGLSETSIADLRLFARFHDIGKVGIPDNILFKPGKLNEDEWAVMRQHCEIGYRIAKVAPDLSPIADLIMKHQEWWNGKGYPRELAGEEIPFECRLLAIIDAFDAMTSDRPYRKALHSSVAVEEIKRCAGTQFDPDLVGKFILFFERLTPNILNTEKMIKQSF